MKLLIRVFIFILIFLFISCISKKDFIENNPELKIKLPDTDKKFYINFYPINLRRAITKSPVLLSIYKYFGENKTDDPENAYSFTIYFNEFRFYTNLTQDDKIQCLFIIESTIKIFSDKNELLLQFFISSQNEEIIDNKLDLDMSKDKLCKKTFDDFLQKMNENGNYLSFLKNEKPSKKVIDSSALYKNKIQSYENLKNINKNEYRLFFSNNFYSGIDANFNFQENRSNLGIKLLCGFEFYPIELFSIEYRFNYYHILSNTLLNIMNLSSSLFQLHLYNDINLNFNFFKSTFYCPTVYSNFGYALDFFSGSNYNVSMYMFNPKIYQFDSYSQVCIHSLYFGFGFKLGIENPYIKRLNTQIAFELYYSPIYIDYVGEWQHRIGFAVYINYKSNLYVYRKKPYKLVTSKRFRTR